MLTVISRALICLSGISAVYHVLVMCHEFRHFQWETLFGHFILAIPDFLVQKHFVVLRGLRVPSVRGRDRLYHIMFANGSFLKNDKFTASRRRVVLECIINSLQTMLGIRYSIVFVPSYSPISMINTYAIDKAALQWFSKLFSKLNKKLISKQPDRDKGVDKK